MTLADYVERSSRRFWFKVFLVLLFIGGIVSFALGSWVVGLLLWMILALTAISFRSALF